MFADVLVDFKEGVTNFYAGEFRKFNQEQFDKYIGYGWIQPRATFSLDIQDSKVKSRGVF